MISVVSGKICPPRNCHGRRVFKNLDDFSCNTPNQLILDGLRRVGETGWEEARLGPE
jgi:hypothetical protein